MSAKAEITIRLDRGDYKCELRKVDSDTWLLLVWEERNGKEINKNAITLFGDQLRALCENEYVFGR